jgi:O-succinylbenzoic acid--CoA ligase
MSQQTRSATAPTPPDAFARPFLASAAAVRPQHPALLVGSTTLSYEALWAGVQRLADAWVQVGIVPGERVGILLVSSLDYALCIHAANLLGVTLVLLNTRLTGPELDYQLALTACRRVIYHEDTAALRQAITLPHRAHAMATLHALSRAGTAVPAAPTTTDTPLAIVFTSGTSGQPKAALLTVGTFYASAVASTQRIGRRDDDRWLCVLPLYHVGGLSILLRAAIDKTTVELMPRFSEALVNERLHTSPVTLLSVVPTMLYRMLQTRQRHQAPQALRLVLLGGTAPTEAVLAQAAAAGIPVATTYGLTEAASQVATALPDLPQRKPGTVGQPLSGNRIRIVDDHGADLPSGTPGEILVSGPTLLREYVNSPEATARALRDGWLHTGDIGYLDADGDLFVLLRRTDLIISGGENIYPAEVERVLLAHPSVQQALVVGLPDEEWGQVVGALVVADTSVDEAVLRAFCQGRLARYKQPRRLVIAPEMPLTASGKPDRRQVMQILMAL